MVKGHHLLFWSTWCILFPFNEQVKSNIVQIDIFILVSSCCFFFRFVCLFVLLFLCTICELQDLQRFKTTGVVYRLQHMPCLVAIADCTHVGSVRAWLWELAEMVKIVNIMNKP